MDAAQELSSLAERKKVLLAQCQLQREMLALECQTIRYRTKDFGRRLAKWPRMALWVAPLVGMAAGPAMARLTSRRGRGDGGRRRRGALARAWLLVSTARKAWRIVRAMRRT